MPKRYNRSREEDIEHFKHKIRKLERKIQERQNSDSENNESNPEAIIEFIDEETEAATPALRPDDWLLQWPENPATDTVIETSEPQAGPSETPASENHADLDTDVLAILGDEPANSDKRGPEIHNELASRLLHITKTGLNKETRKELLSKYLVPANCIEIDAPKINPEIKAAMTEAAIRRDKGIETKQKQLSSAIACLSDVLNSQINSRLKNNDMLQKLMDTTKILCDLQHADSITRKNFILFSLKNDIKGHLKNTNIDSFLFGENLPETLKSAKAVNKSAVELKAETFNKPLNTYRTTTQRALNRKAPSQAPRPPTGPALPTPRSREPAAAHAPYRPRFQYQPPPQAQSSRTAPFTQQQGSHHCRRRN